jgi:3-deoxy-D-manno-octulosonic-acid transferase
MKHLLLDKEAQKEIGEKGYRFLQEHQGATDRIFEEIKPYLITNANCRF